MYDNAINLIKCHSWPRNRMNTISFFVVNVMLCVATRTTTTTITVYITFPCAMLYKVFEVRKESWKMLFHNNKKMGVFAKILLQLIL